jgi:hypothetical protein
MRFLREYRFLFLFLALLVFCSVMVVRQYQANESKHDEIRDAFILLYTKGYRREAEALYERLIRDCYKLPNDQLNRDFFRTLVLIDPLATNQTDNLIFNYHWTVSKEMDKRLDRTLQRALKLAGEK